VAGPVFALAYLEALRAEFDAVGVHAVEPALFGLDVRVRAQRAARGTQGLVQRHAELEADDVRPREVLAHLRRTVQVAFGRGRRLFELVGRHALLDLAFGQSAVAATGGQRQPQ